MNEKKCESHCPEGNSADIVWDVSDWTDGGPCQDGVCQKCNCLFREWYKYDITTYSEGD